MSLFFSRARQKTSEYLDITSEHLDTYYIAIDSAIYSKSTGTAKS